MRWLLVATFLFVQDAKKFPTCPPDWRLDIVAQVPRIEHPSVVCCAPDGRIFVGIDPMDMRGPSNKPGDSIYCIHPDGRITVFASRLYAVFGMLYLDGKLYVHHVPKISVFTDDDGVGKDRVDLIECTNPNPTQAGFNDHIPSQIRLAMDGYLYLSTGDKGIYGFVGKDGRKLELRGGGIIRMRPDGTEAEVYCSGTRNHLDIAIHPDDEMFTYDNTDDGNGWWTRVTHMIDGGYYGYPWDYKPRRPYTLWMMGDYQGGSGCGGVSYNEDALPPEYHGNLFFCEWTRSQLLRLRVERDGGTFKIASRENFSTGPSDYRPLGICVSPDGLSLYLTDWNFGGWLRPDRKGRLLKYTYTGKSHAAPRPDWFIDAASGRKFKATTAELCEALGHPAQSVRLVAQRRLVDRKEIQPVLAALKNGNTRAKWHAIWTLDALKAGRDEIIEALNDPDARTQAARQLGTRRVKEAVDALLKLPIDRPVAAALGRIGDPRAVPALLEALDEKDLFTRYAIFTALKRIGAWKDMVKGLEHKNPRVREGTLFALREVWDETIVDALSSYVENILNPTDTRAGALQILADLLRREPPWDGVWWGVQPILAGRPARTIDWAATPKIQNVLRESIKDLAPPVRAIALNAAVASNDPKAAEFLREVLSIDSEIDLRRTAIRALARLKDASTGPLLAPILRDLSSPLLPDALSAAGSIGGQDVIEALASTEYPEEHLVAALRAQAALRIAVSPKHLDSPNSKVVIAAIESLSKSGQVDPIVTKLTDDRRSVRRAAAAALGSMQARAAIPALLSAFEDKSIRAEVTVALASMPDLRALHVYTDGLSHKFPEVRTACRKAILALGEKVPDHLRPAKPILAWKILGPFPNPTQEPFPVDNIPMDRDWKEIQARETDGRVDFESKNDATMYAVTTIESESERDIELVAGSDDSLTLWLNGQKVFEDLADHAWSADMFRVNARLKAGTNVLLAKIGHHGGEWRFSVAIVPKAAKGDAARGKELFKSTRCAKCHKVSGEGGDVGPDLAIIGSKYDRAALIESILQPSKQILDGYRQTIVQTADGGDVRGLLRSETATELTIVDSEANTHVIKKSDIKSRRQSDVSVMPEGLTSVLSAQEFADLIEYLQTLQSKD
jgi:putative heme-binding domain-containing protein